MQRANRWRIRDEEEYTIALAYLYRSFEKSPSFWRTSLVKEQAREALQKFDDKLRVAMQVGKSRNRHKRTQVTLDKAVHERLSAQAKALGLNLSQTVSLLLDQFQHKER